MGELEGVFIFDLRSLLQIILLQIEEIYAYASSAVTAFGTSREAGGSLSLHNPEGIKV
jgi:hypothetical protein